MALVHSIAAYLSRPGLLRSVQQTQSKWPFLQLQKNCILLNFSATNEDKRMQEREMIGREEETERES
jgi:hypothetical protein